MSRKGDTGVQKGGQPMSPEAVRTYQEPVCNSFDGFWKAYPKKRGRQDALKAWAKLNPDEATSRRIVQQVKPLPAPTNGARPAASSSRCRRRTSTAGASMTS